MDQLLDDYPELEKEDIRVALLYASQLVDEEPVLDTAIYHTQQCAEKALKGSISSDIRATEVLVT